MAYKSQYARRREKAFLADVNARDTGGKYPPCLNPHCKSHGQGHPNCKCYSGGNEFADGGDVKAYCAYGKPHMPECEYYKGGSFADSVMASRKVRK